MRTELFFDDFHELFFNFPHEYCLLITNLGTNFFSCIKRTMRAIHRTRRMVMREATSEAMSM